MYRLIQKYYPDGSTALNLDMILHKCINVANELYGTRIELVKNDNRILVQSDINAVTAQIIQILDTVCLTNNSARVIIDSDAVNKLVTVSFECDGICGGMSLEFELYTGIPSNVISDKEAEAVLEALVRDIFEKAAKIRKSRNKYEKLS
ncbi:MAG: hypothetical protein IJZ20_00395 [Clostridia bacterium]|nr:hypothetical protein [Clostridia bacterium]